MLLEAWDSDGKATTKGVVFKSLRVCSDFLAFPGSGRARSGESSRYSSDPGRWVIVGVGGTEWNRGCGGGAGVGVVQGAALGWACGTPESGSWWKLGAPVVGNWGGKERTWMSLPSPHGWRVGKRVLLVCMPWPSAAVLRSGSRVGGRTACMHRTARCLLQSARRLLYCKL